MKNFPFLIALAGLALIGAAQNTQVQTVETKKTIAVKKSPTPVKKTSSAAGVKKAAPNSQTSTSGTNAAKKSSVPMPAATSPAKKAAPKRDDRAELDAALGIADPEQKITALSKFLKDFSRSELRSRAAESLTAARAAVGDTKLQAGDRENGLKLTRLAISEAPLPYPDKLFTEVIARVPTTLALRGEPVVAIEIASAVEKHSTTAAQLLALANFYLSIENADEARRLAEAALKLNEKSRDAYLALGMASRLNFDLEGASAAFEKAAELDADSVSARQSLAEMKRALGKPEEALAIYTALLEKDGTDSRSRDGKILALFDAGKRTDAETELGKAIESNPGNFVLLAGAAYWYAAKGESTKAIDLAGKAIAAEPRYVWSHVALGRAYLMDGRYTDAEQSLLRARIYGNFPSLDYELAAVRFAAGFYREAVEELEKSFSVKDGNISTKLGRRVERSEKNITDLVAHERRASILQRVAADGVELAAKLKALLELRTALSSASPDPIRASELTDAFAGGGDKMRFYRQIYAANELLEKKVAPAKALELSRSAVGSVDDGLNVPSPAGAMMASELYVKRTAAFAADKYIVVPDVSKQILSSVARGRIEEIAGWSLLQQGSTADAATRLRRAINVLPEKSAWWRSSYWRLGKALKAEGKDSEALDAYIKSYASGDPDAVKYAEIETVYKRVNKSTDGLEALLGVGPAKAEVKAPDTIASASQEVKVPKEIAAPEVKIPSSNAKTEPTPETPVRQTVEKKSDSAVETKIVSVAEKTPEPVPVTTEEKIIPRETPSPEHSIESQKSDAVKTDEVKPVPQLEEVQQKVEEKASDIKPAAKVPIEDLNENGEVKTKSAPVEAAADDTKSPVVSPTPKPLFEPVVIEIKSGRPPVKDGAKKETPLKADEDPPSDLSGRQRVVEGKEVTHDVPPCSISVSQDSISIVAGSGGVGLLVSADSADVKDIKFVSSSPKDIEVSAEPQIAGISGRALFLIKSLSTATGVYQVTFSLPCGKKEVQVKTR